MLTDILNYFNALIKKFIRALKHKLLQTKRLSRKTISFILIMIGATFVSLMALGFAKLADLAIKINTKLVELCPFGVLIAMPIGFMLIVWLTKKYAPYTVGSGIPQVMASLHQNNLSKKEILISFWPTLLKIPFTFLGMLFGASIGREGPTVQVGAAVMMAWGKICQRFNLTTVKLKANDLLAVGAAGGLAAAFNAPLAGVVFAIEELGRSAYLRWEQHIIFGVLVAGLILVAIEGNNPHFPVFHGVQYEHKMILWVLLCALICGVFGGVFAKFLLKGAAYFSPHRFRWFIGKHPIWLAGIMGLLLALIGLYFNGTTYGIGYEISADALNGNAQYVAGFTTGKFMATVFSYWAGLPGGIFTPSLSIGASLGVALNQLVNHVVAMDVMVLLCMAAFLAAATQSPLTASVVVMEMTGSQTMLLWILVCSIVASFISHQFCPRPFYLSVAIKYGALLDQINIDDKKQSQNNAENKS